MTGPTLEELRTWIFATLPEMAAVVRTDQRTLRRSIEAGECPHVRIHGTVRIPVGPFLRWAGIDLETSEASSVEEDAAAPTLRLATTGQSHDHPPAA